MSTNIDRAAEVLADWADNEGGLSAIDRDYDGDLTGGVEALADANPPLLMPDLPEPAEKDGRIYFGDDGKTYALPDGRVAVLHGGWWSYATAEELRTHALALFAAADYAERNSIWPPPPLPRRSSTP